jgi:hypothetical protein
MVGFFAAVVVDMMERKQEELCVWFFGSSLKL